jgi:ATP-dependent helicase/nuclease subunit B
LLDCPAPRWFTIGAHRPFLEDLAAGLWREFGSDPERLAATTVLLPTRRAGRALAEALVEAGGEGAALLPQIRALGDLDQDEPPFEGPGFGPELPPALSAAQRRYELAGLVAQHEPLLGRTLTAEGALELADALAAFLDACHIEERSDPSALAGLADEAFARHWQISARFLDIALTGWQTRLAELGAMDPTARRTALTRALADAWRDAPPKAPVIAAGSTGSSPAGADLLTAIAQAPQGLVVLPGLDLSLAERAWQEVSEGHPQAAMKRLLDDAGAPRSAVRTFDPGVETSAAGRWRRRLVNEALRPPDRTADWLDVIADLQREAAQAAEPENPVSRGLEGLSLIEAANEDETATAAALLMREALETPGRTCALVTPDAALAQRVSARLTRWGVTADVSAGEPLASHAPAVLAARVSQAAADPLDPVALLAIAKHPLVRFGLAPGPLAAGRRRLERRGLRGQRPASWDALLEELSRDADIDDPALVIVAELRAALERAGAPFANGAAAATDAARGAAEALERLCAGPAGEDGVPSGALWAGRSGEALAEVFRRLIDDSAALPGATARGFADLLSGALSREILRQPGGTHPRLRILGVLEARLLRSDLTILGGLEEGVWPAGAGADPFLSRPMREKLGLPAPERRIGLSAHDFAQAACAPDVVLLVSQRREGSPAVASRWIWRLKTLAQGAKSTIPSRPEILAWARALDAPIADPPAALRTAARPAPTPPIEARPRRMGVTTVERWVRDPYAIYARYILGLEPLSAPDEPVEAKLRGTAVHAAFEAFARAWPEALPADAEARFVELLMAALTDAGMPRARLAREEALARNLAPWVSGFERQRRQGARLVVETRGEHSFEAPYGPFTLTAKADRLEIRDGRADILDFKTGRAPTKAQVETHLTPQLTLTAAILAAGGFEAAGPLSPGELVYVRVTGGRTPGEATAPCRGNEAELAQEALAGLARWVARFDQPQTPYRSWERPQFVGQGGDYDHLARVWEWRVIGEGAAEGLP